MSKQDDKECMADQRRRETQEMLDQDPNAGRRSSVNWHESTLLVKHQAPEEPVMPQDVADYLDEVETYARDVLNDLGITDPVIPLPLDVHRRLYDPEFNEETADGMVAVRLLEYATFLKRMRVIDLPNRQQVDAMLQAMAQISALTSMSHLHGLVMLRGKVENQRATRERNAEIRRLRANGEKIATLAIQFDLTERRILTITEKK